MKEHRRYKKLLLQEHCWIRNRIFILTFFFFTLSTVYAQVDWFRWDKSESIYQINKNASGRNYDLTIKSAADLFIKPVVYTYWFFISDVDGSNCPFTPSCSNFFLESVKETNILQGTLMFFDRFARDTNIFEREIHYTRTQKNLFFDPVTQYTLDQSRIIFSPVNLPNNE